MQSLAISHDLLKPCSLLSSAGLYDMPRRVLTVSRSARRAEDFFTYVDSWFPLTKIVDSGYLKRD